MRPSGPFLPLLAPGLRGGTDVRPFGNDPLCPTGHPLGAAAQKGKKMKTGVRMDTLEFDLPLDRNLSGRGIGFGGGYPSLANHRPEAKILQFPSDHLP